MKHRELRYDIDYLTADGTKRGQEPCTVTVHSDGQRTIRARSEIFDTEIVRDVVYTVDAGFRPVDCFIRVRQFNRSQPRVAKRSALNRSGGRVGV